MNRRRFMMANLPIRDSATNRGNSIHPVILENKNCISTSHSLVHKLSLETIFVRHYFRNPQDISTLDTQPPVMKRKVSSNGYQLCKHAAERTSRQYKHFSLIEI